MSRSDVPVVITVPRTTGSSTSIGGDATEVILRARSSNVQAISLNVSTSTESDPTVAGANVMILFPCKSIRLPADPAT